MEERGSSQDSYSNEQIEAWLNDARNGCTIALGKLVGASQAYLRSVAHRSLPGSLRAKLSPSDLVQDTVLEAHRDFSSFQGEHFEELLAWMRQILLHNVSNYTRHFEQTAKRNIAREICGEQAASLIDNVTKDVQTPSSQLASLEQRAAVEEIMAKLGEEMRTVITLRNKEGLSFVEIGLRLQCTPAAARKLWARAIERMQQLLPNHDDQA